MKKMWVMTSVSTLGPTVNGVQVPKGRLTVHAVSLPFGTYCAWMPDPNVETLGYRHKSLRDNDLPDVWECSRRSNPSGIGLSSPQQLERSAASRNSAIL